ncbi:MAG: PC4/YdbC family ssDNA-binding protein [Anaerovoracaceae bacterium]
MSNEILFEKVKSIGVLAEYPTGWTKELNLISWNDGTPKYDIRDWDADHTHMSRGVTLHLEEAKKLFELLAGEMK